MQRKKFALPKDCKTNLPDLSKKSKYLKYPTKPIDPEKIDSVSDLLEGYKCLGFQAKSLAQARQIWKKMFQDKTTIFMGLAGAMVPAGLRKMIKDLIKYRAIDCLVSTGANLFHDAHESLGYTHYLGHHQVDDIELQKNKVDRIYDVFASENEFWHTDAFVEKFSVSLDHSKPYTTREFFYLLGKRLLEEGKGEGILTEAYKQKLPIYCPAFGDSSLGIACATAKVRSRSKLVFDILEDVLETCEIVLGAACTGVVYIGGGTPKNFIQQTAITASFLTSGQKRVEGHKYAIQVITDSPQWGGLSGCTFEEAQSWGKIAPEAKKVTVYSDATIALPLIVSDLLKEKETLAQREKPTFAFFPEIK